MENKDKSKTVACPGRVSKKKNLFSFSSKKYTVFSPLGDIGISDGKSNHGRENVHDLLPSPSSTSPFEN